jgi:hypothetical protein
MDLAEEAPKALPGRLPTGASPTRDEVLMDAPAE